MRTTIYYFTSFQSESDHFELGHDLQFTNRIHMFERYGADEDSIALRAWALTAKIGEMHECGGDVAVCVWEKQIEELT